MSSLDIACVVTELRASVVGRRVDNIYHIPKKIFLFKLTPGNTFLLFEVERRVHLTDFDYPIPAKPTSFCAALRKRLRGGRVSSIVQMGFERIVRMGIDRAKETVFLYCELFPRGNIVVTDPNNRIQLAFEYREMRDRKIAKGETWVGPPTRFDPFEVNQSTLLGLRSASGKPIAIGLTELLAIGGELAEELASRANVIEKTCDQISAEDVSNIIRCLAEIRELISIKKFSPRVVKTSEGEPRSATPIEFVMNKDQPFTFYPSANNAFDEYFRYQFDQAAQMVAAEAVESKHRRLEKILAEQSRQLVTLSQKIHQHRAGASKIIENLHVLNELLEHVRKDLENAGKTEQAKLTDRFTVGKARTVALDLANGLAEIEIDGVVIPLEIKQTPQKVANDLFTRAKKLESKRRRLELVIQQTHEKLSEIKKTEGPETQVVKLDLRTQKKWFTNYRWFYSSDGHLVVGGKDSSSNEALIKRHASGDDVVFHAEIIGAPFFLVKASSGTIPEQTLKETAEAAAAYSRAWKLGLSAVDVFWVKADQLTKTPPAGQYLARGAFGVVGPKNFVRDVPLRLAVGIVEDQNGVTAVAGPVGAVKRLTHAVVEIIPDDETMSKLSKRIVGEIEKLHGKPIPQSTVQQIQGLIPFAGGRLARAQ